MTRTQIQSLMVKTQTNWTRIYNNLEESKKYVIHLFLAESYCIQYFFFVPRFVFDVGLYT